MKSQSLLTFLAGLALSAAAAIRSPEGADGSPSLANRAVSVTPSLAPQVVWQGERLGTVFASQSDRQAVINDQKSSLFRFLFTDAFAGTERCALQFRMPSCATLPEDYPCYKWSGLLSEAQNSRGFYTMPETDVGWVINLSDNERLQTNWITQVYPGAVTEVGSFHCGKAGETIDFLIQNDRGLDLEFKQGTDNGVGFWVVPKP